jgi:hypothetical protein
MILTRFLEWSVSVRTRRFPGRSLLGQFYRFLLFTIFHQALKLAYRTGLFLKMKRGYPFLLSDYRLLKEVRLHFPAPYLARRWLQSLLPGPERVEYTGLLSRMHAAKSRTQRAPWLLPETAILAPALDCKGFAVLLSSLLNVSGITNELWIGLPSNGQDGHAWVVLETKDGRIAVDQCNGHGIRESDYLSEHTYSITFKI